MKATWTRMQVDQSCGNRTGEPTMPVLIENVRAGRPPTQHRKRSKYEPTQLLTSCMPKVHFPNGGKTARVAVSLIAIPRSTSSARAASCTSAAMLRGAPVQTYSPAQQTAAACMFTFMPEQRVLQIALGRPALERAPSFHGHPPAAAGARHQAVCPH